MDNSDVDHSWGEPLSVYFTAEVPQKSQKTITDLLVDKMAQKNAYVEVFIPDAPDQDHTQAIELKLSGLATPHLHDLEWIREHGIHALFEEAVELSCEEIDKEHPEINFILDDVGQRIFEPAP